MGDTVKTDREGDISQIRAILLTILGTTVPWIQADLHFNGSQRFRQLAMIIQLLIHGFQFHRVALRSILFAVGIFLPLVTSTQTAFAAIGHLELRVVDGTTAEPLAANMRLWDSKGRSRKVRGVTAVGDRFVVDGALVLKLPPGNYTFKIERGLEYRDREGNFQIRSAARDNHTVSMERFVDMRALGWVSADFGNVRSKRDLDALLSAFDLQHFAGSTSAEMAWDERRDASNDRSSDLRGVFDTQRQLALLRLADSPPTSATALSAAELLKIARAQPDSHCQAMDVTASDFPMWAASGALDAVAIFTNATANKSTPTNTLAPDKAKFPGRRGAARWREHVYHQLLEAGIRIAPTAASYSPKSHGPSGQPRTYAKVAPQPHDDRAQFEARFWSALENGHTMLTCGPLLIAKVNGQPPGYVFDGSTGDTIELKPALTLHTKENISYLEILKNGQVAHQIRLDDWVKAAGELPAVSFDKSGWMLVRAVVDSDDTYRFAMTAPCFVEFESEPRISSQATAFFTEWAKRRWEETKGTPVERFHTASVKFWQSRSELTNAP